VTIALSTLVENKPVVAPSIEPKKEQE